MVRRQAVPSNQAGFNMVEVMVALAVLSIGLLGLAGLQTMGLRLNQQSYQRTQAVIQAYDLVDRIRANWQCVGNDACKYSDVAIGEIPGSPPNCISSNGSAVCTSTDMATYDVAQWNTVNARLLTKGRGAACRGALDSGLDCTPGAAGDTRYWVAVTWIENDLPMRIDVQTVLPQQL